MHVLHRPHLPRPISATIVAAVLAIVISLALAGSLRINDQAHGSTNYTTRLSNVLRSTPRWESDPLSELLSQPLPPIDPRSSNRRPRRDDVAVRITGTQ